MNIPAERILSFTLTASYSRNGAQTFKVSVPRKHVLRILFLRDKKRLRINYRAQW